MPYLIFHMLLYIDPFTPFVLDINFNNVGNNQLLYVYV